MHVGAVRAGCWIADPGLLQRDGKIVLNGDFADQYIKI
jgi:hypothetical protein